MVKGNIGVPYSARRFSVLFTPTLGWYSNENMQRHKGIKSLVIRPNIVIEGVPWDAGYFLPAFRCQNCGAILVVPPEENQSE
ncbi:MAG: hypothetical protein K2N60_08430 [Oscillospiraceae bacterium]|nr:hypothetical protein [Oscillospiraceae bacterium]